MTLKLTFLISKTNYRCDKSSQLENKSEFYPLNTSPLNVHWIYCYHMGSQNDNSNVCLCATDMRLLNMANWASQWKERGIMYLCYMVSSLALSLSLSAECAPSDAHCSYVALRKLKLSIMRILPCIRPAGVNSSRTQHEGPRACMRARPVWQSIDYKQIRWNGNERCENTTL